MSTFDEGGFAVLVKDLSQAFDVANTVAPEHLQLMIEKSRKLSLSYSECWSCFHGEYGTCVSR